ncbi:MAG: SpaA isopeptide-forming pilin-related protein [Lachnospiraceae bacterium]
MRKSKSMYKAKSVICLSIILVIIIYIFSLEIWADETELGEQSITETELVQEDLETVDEQIDSDNTDTGTICGVLWVDTNKDGIKDEDEIGIDNYPVYLYSAENRDEPVLITVTNQNGLYTFANINPGEYVVEIYSGENDTDYLLPIDGIDNDNKFMPDKENAYTKVITIESKTIIENIDGGMREMPEAITRDALDGYVVTSDDTQLLVGTESTLKDAVELCSSDPDAYTITLTSNDNSMTDSSEIVDDDVYVTIPENCTIKLTSGIGGPYTITQQQRSAAAASSIKIQNARHLKVEGSLILDNIILEGAGYNSEYPFGYTGGVYVEGGFLTMQNDAAITKCYNRDGGAVFVNGKTNTSKFVMTGGIIYDNKAISIQATSSSTYGQGGGVFAYESNASFEMSGGIIKQNEILQNSTGYVIGFGGGVNVNFGASFDMNGTALIDDNAASYGAGVHISEESTFNMYGNAQIRNNIATYDRFGGGVAVRSNSIFNMFGNAVIEQNTALYGGGTYLSASSMNMYEEALVTRNQTYSDGAGGGVIVRFGSDLNMNDYATISDNTSTAGFGGGGVYLTYENNAQSKLDMTDESKIIDNKTDIFGGGVYASGIVEMSQNAKISNNIADNGGGIFIDQDNAAVIMNGNSGITKNIASSNGGGVYAENGLIYMNDTTFISENTANFEGEGGGGGVYLNKTGYLNMTGGTIEKNQADKARGGGVYTMNYLYEDPVNSFNTYYTNITIKEKDDKIFSPFSGNTAEMKYKEPSNADQSTQFYGYDLNNYNINYEGKKVYYPMEFYKVDVQNITDYKYLEDAKFNLYKWTGSEIPSVTVDVDLPGDWEGIAALTSDEDGFVQYEYLEIGKYYQLVEIEAPDGYLVPDGQWQIYVDTAYSTSFPYDFYSVNGSAPLFEKISGKDKYILANEKDLPEHEFDFTKVDAVDNSIFITGVEFKLYEWTGESPISGLVDINNPGTNWNLTDSVESDLTGKVSFKGLVQGAYQLVETQAHSGYRLPAGQWRIALNEDGNFGITAVNGLDESVPPAFSKDSSGSYILGNYIKTQLPAIGGAGTKKIKLLGSALVIVGTGFGLIHFYHKRRAKALPQKISKV